MIVIGLTGGIATGKSTTAAMMVARGIPVHDADAAVHVLMAPGGAAIGPVTQMFGDGMLTTGGAIDRQRLGAAIFSDPAQRRALEAIIHPLVAEDRDMFLARHRQAGSQLVVLDIPLLFETGGEALCDFVILCSASEEIQRRRALQRDGMTATKFESILESQMPLASKRAMADAEIDTGLGLESAAAALDAILDGPVRELHERAG